MPILTLPRAIATWVSLAILALAIYLLWQWGQGDLVRLEDGDLHRVREPNATLFWGLGLLAWSFLGRFVVLMFMPVRRAGPWEEHGTAVTVLAPDGSALQTDSFGQDGAPTLVLTHGWGLDRTAWAPIVGRLKDRFRLTTWDLPGLGGSNPPRDGRYDLDRFAQALGSVIEATGQRRTILVGHSIGGMTTETLWRACPEALRRRIAGLVLVHTTYEDPLKTMWLREVWQALEKPLIAPLNRAAVVLSPLLRLASWQSYLSGSSQIAMRVTGFGRYATRREVDFAARLACKGSPAVQAKGNLAMFAWSAVDLLPRIDVPVLVLAGENDLVTLPEAGAEIARSAPDARLVRVEGVGHMGYMERPELYDDAIRDFAEEAFRRSEADEDAELATSPPDPFAAGPAPPGR